MAVNTEELIANYMRLPEKEKEVIRKFIRSPAAIPVAKVFGVSPDELRTFLQQSRNPRGGLAARQPQKNMI